MSSGTVHKSTKHLCVQCGNDDWSKEAGYWECTVCGLHLYGDFATDPYMRCCLCQHIHFKNQKQCPNCGLIREDDQL